MDNQTYVVQEPKKSNGVSIAALVCGIVSLCCCNPFYLVSVAAVILGIVGLCTNRSKGLAITGMLLGIASVVICIIVDIILIPFTMGLSFFF